MLPVTLPRIRPGGGVRLVEKRASAIQGEYEAKMRKMDGVADRGLHHPRERLMTEFRKYGAIKGLVVGAFGEFSNDLKALMSSFVDAKVPGDPKRPRTSKRRGGGLGTRFGPRLG